MCRELWDEMDVIYVDDEPVPSGKDKISEDDFDRIREGYGDEDDR